jgi:hypothetical protein
MNFTGAEGLARRSLLTVLVASAVVSCGPPSVSFTFVNRTSSALCEYPSPEDAQLARCRTELRAGKETGGGRDCDNDDSRPIRVIITVKQEGRRIYDETAACSEWADTDRTFVIEQIAGEFVVTDSLPHATPVR